MLDVILRVFPTWTQTRNLLSIKVVTGFGLVLPDIFSYLHSSRRIIDTYHQCSVFKVNWK